MRVVLATAARLHEILAGGTLSVSLYSQSYGQLQRRQTGDRGLSMVLMRSHTDSGGDFALHAAMTMRQRPKALPTLVSPVLFVSSSARPVIFSRVTVTPRFCLLSTVAQPVHGRAGASASRRHSGTAA
jgi:hypothetical protein